MLQPSAVGTYELNCNSQGGYEGVIKGRGVAVTGTNQYSIIVAALLQQRCLSTDTAVYDYVAMMSLKAAQVTGLVLSKPSRNSPVWLRL